MPRIMTGPLQGRSINVYETSTPLVLNSQTFNASGTWTRPAGVSTVEVLVVAGGAGGANGLASTVSNVTGAGGGAGGVLYTASHTVTGNVTVTVGAGGTLGNGSNSSFGSLTAIGGDYSGSTGGSGVGGAWETGTLGAGHLFPGLGTSGQGNDGGDCYTSGTTTQASNTAGGGGGAGSVGSTATAVNTGGNGGTGVSYFTGQTGAWSGGGGGAGGAGGLGTAGTATSGGGNGGTQVKGASSMGATLSTSSKSITLTSGDTTGLVAGMFIVRTLDNSGTTGQFASGTKIVSVTSSTQFTVDLFPTTAGACTFGAARAGANATANSGGGGGGAGRPTVNTGYSIDGGSGGSGVVIVRWYA
jgi:hypothetical protein